jgi:hypothetical protein
MDDGHAPFLGQGSLRRFPRGHETRLMSVDARETLAQGRALLDPVLAAHGFHFDEAASTAHSTDAFARGTYLRDGRRMELGCREELVAVVYQLEELIITHDTYMHTVLGPAGSNMFPCFTGDPLDGFRHLKHDLELYATVFLRGTDAQFRQLVARSRTIAADERTTLYRR